MSAGPDAAAHATSAASTVDDAGGDGDGEASDDDLCVLALNESTWHCPEPGGAERNLEATLSRLAARGHSVHLLAGAEADQPPTGGDDVVVHRVGLADRVGAPWDVVLSYLTVSLYFYWYAFRLSPDVVYTVNSPLHWPVVTSAPRVPIYHHIAVDDVFDTHPFPLDWALHVVQRVGLYRDRSATTVSVSPSTTRALLEHGHDPATVHEVRNGVDVDAFPPGEEASEPRLLFVGGHRRYKGADRLPAIHRAVEERHDGPVRLDVAGRSGPVSDELRAYCEDAPDARFHGYVSEERKLELLQSAWVLVAPSRFEGWGISVIEANACRTPAVGSDVPGLRDSIDDGRTGLLCDGGSPEAFADCVGSLLDDDARRQRLGSRARSWARAHSWTAAVDDLEALFQSCAASESSATESAAAPSKQ